MKYTIHVEDFGKIKKASIKVAPLTLLVGDNNSGKSYLLSLIWAFQSFEMHEILFQGMEQMVGFKELADQISPFIEGKATEVKVASDDFLPVLNELLQRNKESLVTSIFNSTSIGVGKLAISTEHNYIFTIKGSPENVLIFEETPETGISFGVYSKMGKQFMAQQTINLLFSLVLLNGQWDSIYFPAARTGFVLAKDVINKAARKSAFDAIKSFEGNGGESLEPFTKPIMNFLDAMNITVSQEGGERNQKLLHWIQAEMSHGKVNYRDAMNQNIEYYPEGLERGLPLRAVSAVVTELTPLMLLLQYQKNLDFICYEEPEMCLHPQLQLKMAKLLVRMVSAGITIVATTHSDIILQYINNACVLSSLGKPRKLLSTLELTEEDCISVKDVAVYQLKDQGAYSEVRELEATDNGFEVPTFKIALQDILSQTSEIYTYEEQGD